MLRSRRLKESILMSKTIKKSNDLSLKVFSGKIEQNRIRRRYKLLKRMVRNHSTSPSADKWSLEIKQLKQNLDAIKNKEKELIAEKDNTVKDHMTAQQSYYTACRKLDQSYRLWNILVAVSEL